MKTLVEIKKIPMSPKKESESYPDFLNRQPNKYFKSLQDLIENWHDNYITRIIHPELKMITVC